MDSIRNPDWHTTYLRSGSLPVFPLIPQYSRNSLPPTRSCSQKDQYRAAKSNPFPQYSQAQRHATTSRLYPCLYPTQLMPERGQYLQSMPGPRCMFKVAECLLGLTQDGVFVYQCSRLREFRAMTTTKPFSILYNLDIQTQKQIHTSSNAHSQTQIDSPNTKNRSH